MNNELAAMQNELTISKQQVEIMNLKLELQKTQVRKASRLEDSLFSPSLYEHYQKVAETLSRSGVIPIAYRGKQEDIFVSMAMGYQLGFPVEQSLQDIAIINGRPCLWGDGLLSLALNHPECLSVDEEAIYDEKERIIGYSCTVIRKGHKPHTKRFTLQDAQQAGLLSRGPVWKAYPERMLQMRARSFAIRDKFADALRGLRIAEIEEEDSRIIDAEVSNVTLKGNTQTDKLKYLLEYRNKNEERNVNNNSNIDSSLCAPFDIPSSSKNIGEEDHISGILINDPKLENDLKISHEQIEKIYSLFEEKNFNEERISNAKKYMLNFCKIEKLEDIPYLSAESFIKQLEKST